MLYIVVCFFKFLQYFVGQHSYISCDYEELLALAWLGL